MQRTRRALSAVVLACVAAAGAGETAARADEPIKIETADGTNECREFTAKNDKELVKWEKEQPSSPYVYPREDNVLGAPWGAFLKSIGATPDLFLATILPHVGAQYRLDAPAVVVAWPWSVPLGPAYTCSRRQGTFTVDSFRSHRALLEPGVVSGQRGTGAYVRPGYRFIYHPSEWVVGAGGGLGSTIDIAGLREPFRFSVSPEAVLQFGHCCGPDYFILSFRYDHYFKGTAVDVIGGTLGFTYF